MKNVWNILQFTYEILSAEGLRSGYVPRPVIPIDDIGKNVPKDYAKGEKDLRCKLAALYRLVDHFGWTQSVYNHITVIIYAVLLLYYQLQ